jgi:DNA-directed RNA polymerase beta subunit
LNPNEIKSKLMNVIADSKFPNEGIIEYIDTNEVNNTYIAMTDDDLIKDHPPYINQFTHCEIHPGTILGAVASVIPFSDDNQSPRNCYQCLSAEENVLMADGTRKKIKLVETNPDGESLKLLLAIQ